MTHIRIRVGLRRAALLGMALAYGSTAGAQSLDTVFNADEQRIKLAQASQERIDTTVNQTRSLTDQYKSVMKEVDGLDVYNTLLQRQIDNQEIEIADLTESIDKVTVIERQIMPLMLRMIDSIEQFVDMDVPFLLEERTERIGFLKGLMERSDVSVAEKFRRVLEAYQVENDFGRTIESYKGMLEVGGGQREVAFLRVGRVGLYYQTVDARYTGAWDKKSQSWEELSGTDANQVKQGLKIALKQVAPDLLLLKVNAPEAAQ